MLLRELSGRLSHENLAKPSRSALAYCAAWIGGNGCIPLNFLMEDAATAEIARVQLWQWVYHKARLVRLHYPSKYF